FKIFTLFPLYENQRGQFFLLEECKKITTNEIDRLLFSKGSKKTDEVATTMFTSGSSGMPKGVSFSIYNIVSKRFARAAALPEVGNETFLSYLPLFHTFGRYLELIGSIFWNGTYVFAGNSSSETLFALFTEVNPTGFISIPLRWQELYDRCQEKIGNITNKEMQEHAIHTTVGSRLKWGLSAAGYLDPIVFRFFNNFGINLCSGFGMTEATGGITMTPPGNYTDATVGIPLPGIITRLTTESELEIGGHYVGRYLEDAGPGNTIPYPVDPEKDHWIKTGDIFSVDEKGYHKIIDRIKDIYKNNRGQTVAPQVIEKMFHQVPGMKGCFLVGDNRPYNVLLIIPDHSDPVFSLLEKENLTEYFHQIVTAANAKVAPYERVVNFALIDRDFSIDLGEITPKGSFNRKIIEKNFSLLIESLYVSNVITILSDGFSITIPRWFYRDLGILDNDITLLDNRLLNRRSNLSLTVTHLEKNLFRIGDFRYRTTSEKIDLGVFARQPGLWLGNPELIAFCPVKEGWDVSMGNIDNFIHFERKNRYNDSNLLRPNIRNQELIRINHLLCQSFYFDEEVSFKATEELGQLFSNADIRVSTLLLLRFEALAFHPSEAIRTLAYRILLLLAPDPARVNYIPAFLESGLSFLNEESIKKIASGNFGKHRLDALKRRLYWYRQRLAWPAEERHRVQFESVLDMLYRFAVTNLDYYVSVRAELSRWILHKNDPSLSRKAEELFNQLAIIFEKTIEEHIPRYPISFWNRLLVFEHGILASEKESITETFMNSTFLQESVILAFNEPQFDLPEVPDRGIWIVRLQAHKKFMHYRLGINTKKGKHYDLHLVMSVNPDFKPNPETFYWLASLAGFPFGPAVAPLLGSSRPNLGILTTQYIGGLTAWDKIREYSEIHQSIGSLNSNAWKKTFITALSVIFKACQHSGYRIVPGVVSPSNVMVPELDFKECGKILSLTGWSEYSNTLSIVAPMVEDFYCKTNALYPWCRKELEIRWIFDACLEALGISEGGDFLNKMQSDLLEQPVFYFDSKSLKDDLDYYMEH
ncbi:MAG: AMP-binding protein, partial [Bacteroidota bacterium]